MLKLLTKELILFVTIAAILSSFFLNTLTYQNPSDPVQVKMYASVNLAMTTVFTIVTFWPLMYQFLRGF